MDLVSLYSFSFFLSLISRSWSWHLTKRIIMGDISSSPAFRGFLSRWLTLMSSACRGGWTFSTVFARETTAAVVSSSASLMPLTLRQWRLPCCSSASCASSSRWTSPLSWAIVASRSHRAVFREVTSSCREEMRSTKCLLPQWQFSPAWWRSVDHLMTPGMQVWTERPAPGHQQPHWPLHLWALDGSQSPCPKT